MEMGSTKCSVGKQLARIPWNSQILNQERLHSYHHIMVSCHTKARYPRFAHADLGLLKGYRIRQKSWKAFTMPISLNGSSTVESEDYSSNEDNKSEESLQESARPLSSDELQALLYDQERSKLVRKLSEANQQNRYLKRQLHANEDSLVNFKSELALMELEVQALVKLAGEISQLGIPEGSRKINGKYIQSHLHLRLQAMHDKLKEQIKGVEAAQSKEVPLLWHGMAESVQVMGSFDGWSQGEHLSPEYDGSFTTFTTTLMLRPGRYEIKFLVDGDWQLSPEYPEIGEGLTKNNLLLVE